MLGPGPRGSRTPEVDQYLLRNETCVALVRRHWAMIAPEGSATALTWVLWWVVLQAGPSAYVSYVASSYFLLSGAWFAWLAVNWHHESLAVTDKRLLLVSGLLTRKLAVMPLSKVTDMTYERTVAGRVLGYGTFIMESAGQHQALSRVEFVRNPDKLYLRLSQQLFGGGVPSLTAPADEDALMPPPPPVNPLSTAGTSRLPRV